MTTEYPCTDLARDRLDDFADGLLDAESAKVVAGHLESCPACRHELEWLRRFERTARNSHLSSAEIVEEAWSGQAVNESHLLDCLACREEVQAVHAAIPGEGPRLVKSAPLSARAWTRSWIAPAIAASLLFGFGIILFIGRGAALGPSSRTSLDPSTTRGLAAEVQGLAPSGELPRGRDGLAFSWNGKAGARYAVLFFAGDGRVIARAEASGTRLVAGPELRAKIESEPEFFWKVDPLEGDASTSGSRLTRIAWQP